ncbi:hypothetical protein Nepgr_014788 [Nepenthes gracilis]|uniref:Uncharacterized protein n=1 Tax=Nepenthes gracilis TaxID=150966 RepID=A0AAD3SLX2_NEPGR|nr:hypothetical protein Nepgr_014788 [Nepenthes gracilis]
MVPESLIPDPSLTSSLDSESASPSSSPLAPFVVGFGVPPPHHSPPPPSFSSMGFDSGIGLQVCSPCPQVFVMASLPDEDSSSLVASRLPPASRSNLSQCALDDRSKMVTQPTPSWAAIVSKDTPEEEGKVDKGAQGHAELVSESSMDVVETKPVIQAPSDRGEAPRIESAQVIGHLP